MKRFTHCTLNCALATAIISCLLPLKIAAAQEISIDNNNNSSSHANNSSGASKVVLDFVLGAITSDMPRDISLTKGEQIISTNNKKLTNFLGNNVILSLGLERSLLGVFNIGLKYSYLNLNPDDGRIDTDPSKGSYEISKLNYERHAILGTAGITFPTFSPIQPFIRVGAGLALKNELSSLVQGVFNGGEKQKYNLKSKNEFAWVSEAEIGAQVNILGIKPYAAFFIMNIDAKADSIENYKEKLFNLKDTLTKGVKSISIPSNWQYGINLGLKYSI